MLSKILEAMDFPVNWIEGLLHLNPTIGDLNNFEVSNVDDEDHTPVGFRMKDVALGSSA